MFLDKILRMSLGFLVSVWLARHLGPADFGVFSYSMALVAIGSAIATLGLDSIVSKELLSNPNEREKTIATTLFLQLLAGMFTFGIILCLVWQMQEDNPIVILAVAILGPINFFKASESVKYWFDSQLLSKVTIRAENAIYVLFACIKSGLIYFGFGLIPILVSILFESFVAAFVLLYVYRFKEGVLSLSKFSKQHAGQLLSQSWPFLVSSIAVMVYLRIDIIMLERFLGPTVVGNYGVATRINEVLYFLPGIIVVSFFPTIVKARNSDKGLYEAMFVKLLALLTWLGIIISTFLSLASSWVIETLFGPNFLQAAPLLTPLAWCTVFVFVGMASGRWFLMENLQHLLLFRTITGACINIILNMFLIPKYGAVGAVWATLVSQAYVNYFANVLKANTRNLFWLLVDAFLYPFVLLKRSFAFVR